MLEAKKAKVHPLHRAQAIRNGFKPSTIKAGVEVTIKGFRAKDASQKMGMLRELATADGQVFGLFGPTQGPDAR